MSPSLTLRNVLETTPFFINNQKFKQLPENLSFVKQFLNNLLWQTRDEN